MSKVKALVMGVVYKGAGAGDLLIARNGELPIKSPEEMRHFKAWTTGHAVVMGRKTFESIGQALPDRANYVVTRNADYVAKGCTVCPTLESAISLAKLDAPTSDTTVFVIGGGEVYEETLQKQLADLVIIDAIYVNGEYAAEDGDLFFPRLLLENKYRKHFERKLSAEGNKMYNTIWQRHVPLV